MVRNMRRMFSIGLAVVVIFSNMPGVALADDEVSPLQRALGVAFYSKAELALLKGELNKGKVYLAAAHDADPCMSPLSVKAMDMMYKDFPFVDDVVEGYRGERSSFSGDQKYFAFCHGGMLVRYDLATGESKTVKMVGEVFSFRVDISYAGSYVSISDNKGNLALYDVMNEKHVGIFSLGKETVRGGERIEMDFSRDEKTIAAYYGQSKERVIFLLSTEDLSIVRTVPVAGHVRPLRYVDGGSLLLGIGNKIVIADGSTLEERQSVGDVPYRYDADYLAAKNLVAVGTYKSIQVFNMETQKKVAEYQAASHNILLVRYLSGGRYLVYASPKGESGVIDCATGKVVQVFDIGRDASLSTERYLLLTEGKTIDLSACRVYDGAFKAVGSYGGKGRISDIPDSVNKALAATVDKGISKTGGGIGLVVKSDSGRLGAFSTGDGRTFIYDYKEPAKVVSVTADLTCLTTEVKMVVTDHYRQTTDLVFDPDEGHLIRLCKSGNGMVSAVEVYSLVDGKRNSLRMEDPIESLAIIQDGRAAIILDEKNRVFLSRMPMLDCKIELLGATEVSRQIHVDQQSKTLVVKTGEKKDSYDLSKVSVDATIPTYEDAVKRYGISLNKSESLWDMVGR